VSRQVRQQPAFVFTERHSPGDQELKIFRLHDEN
jgi:hypothetical protein